MDVLHLRHELHKYSRRSGDNRALLARIFMQTPAEELSLSWRCPEIHVYLSEPITGDKRFFNLAD